MQNKFWLDKKLNDLTHEEWEALCSRCGICCLEKAEDQGKIYYSRVACQLFDNITCACSDYKNRNKKVPECREMNADNIAEFTWLPPNCAYRLLLEGKELPEWHYLICGCMQEVHNLGLSAKGCEIYDPEIDFEEIQLYSLEKEDE